MEGKSLPKMSASGDNTSGTSGRAKGQVRIRSNVTIIQAAWHIVPGDVLKRYGLHYEVRTDSKHHEEMMYYTPCSICKRLIYRIMEEGCDQQICLRQGKIPSTAEAARRRSQYEDNPGSSH